MKKRLFFIILILACQLSIAYASSIQVDAPRERMKDPLDELSFINTRISAVTIDMYGYLGWFSDDRDIIARGAEDNINRLENILQDLEKLDVPEELRPIKELETSMGGGLIKAYTGILDKSAGTLRAEFIAVQDKQKALSDKLEAAYGKYGWLKELPEEYDPVMSELPLLKSDADREIYLRALDLIRSNEYEDSYAMLLTLREKYAGTDFEPCVNLKISDCLISADSEIKNARGEDSVSEGIEILSEIIDSGRYSPVLFESFYRWRTITQYHQYGMSNMSDIPNDLYNKKRWELVHLIKKHVEDNPNDIWAKGQVDYLVHLHNITRGGPMGNHNLIDWGILYSNVEPKNPEI